MRLLRFIRSICGALVSAAVIVGAAHGLSFSVAVRGWSILYSFIPVFLIVLFLFICFDSAKITDNEIKDKMLTKKIFECCSYMKEKDDNIHIDVVLDDGAIMPTRAHEADAGYDIYLPEDVIVHRHARSVVIDTGVHIAIPKGYVGMLKSKSGLNVKNGITGEGVIDSGYTGSVVAKLYFGEHHDTLHLERGKKIIQIVIMPIITPELNLVESLDDTERGDDGFGSTGDKL